MLSLLFPKIEAAKPFNNAPKDDEKAQSGQSELMHFLPFMEVEAAKILQQLSKSGGWRVTTLI